MRLEIDGGTVTVRETAWGLAATAAVVAFASLVAAAWPRPPATLADLASAHPTAVWIAGIASVCALLLVKLRYWRFDRVAREACIGSVGILGPRSRRIAYADLRRVAVPGRRGADGKPVGALTLFHAHGVEEFRPYSDADEFAAASALATRLQAELGLDRHTPESIVAELIANGEAGAAMRTMVLLEGLSMMDAHRRAQAALRATGRRTSVLATVATALRSMSFEQLVLLALLAPLILLVLLLGTRVEPRGDRTERDGPDGGRGK